MKISYLYPEVSYNEKRQTFVVWDRKLHYEMEFDTDAEAISYVDEHMRLLQKQG